MNIDRTKAIQLAEAAYHKEKVREANFRAWLCAHLGPGAGNQEADVVMSAPSAAELSDERLALVVTFDSGCPPGISLTADQLDIACEHLLAHS
jgi:hypothetical protein